MLERGLNSLLGLRRIFQVDANLRHGRPSLLHGILKALAALLKGSIAYFLIDAERVFDPGCAHLLPAAQACLILGLPYMNQHAQTLGCVRAGVDREDRK